MIEQLMLKPIVFVKYALVVSVPIGAQVYQTDLIRAVPDTAIAGGGDRVHGGVARRGETAQRPIVGRVAEHARFECREPHLAGIRRFHVDDLKSVRSGDLLRAQRFRVDPKQTLATNANPHFAACVANDVANRRTRDALLRSNDRESLVGMSKQQLVLCPEPHSSR